MTKEKDIASFESSLVPHPEFVQAIGMVTIELANLEIQIADLLGALINRHVDVAHAIYFTPRAVIARVDVVMNVSAILLGVTGEHAAVAKKVNRLLERAKSVMGKRNTLLHAAWGVHETSGEVHYAPLPIVEGGLKLADLRNVKRMIETIRELVIEFSRAQEETSSALWSSSP